MTKQIQVLQQKQALIMSTSMHQSISILQMSNIELSCYIVQALDKNPFIEDETISNEFTNTENITTLKDNLPTGSSYSSYNNSNYNYIENIASRKSLKEHVIEQINLTFNNQRDKVIAYFLLDSLNSNGYLKILSNEAAEILKCDESMIEEIITKLQSFEPAGIFARDLKECLLIQLKEKNNADKALLVMVDNIDLIAIGNIKKLSKLCNITIDKVASLIKQIKGLNPKPANSFYIEPTCYKIPDVILKFLCDGTIKLESNHKAIPKLKVSREYYLQVKNNLNHQQEKDFTKKEIEAANSIVKSVIQRSNTILTVANAIVQEQIEFFTHGIMYLKPLTLNKISSLTNFNESTISRSTANKYISTPNGIFELKYFFSSGLGTIRNSNNNISSTKVKEIIKQIILSEEPDNVLSDAEISTQLSKFNIKISRRTVTKYRESIKISTSAIRKKKILVEKKI